MNKGLNHIMYHQEVKLVIKYNKCGQELKRLIDLVKGTVTPVWRRQLDDEGRVIALMSFMYDGINSIYCTALINRYDKNKPYDIDQLKIMLKEYIGYEEYEFMGCLDYFDYNLK